MEDPKLKYAIEDIEYVLSVHLRPGYLLVLGLETTPGEIDVIVSCSQFKNKSIPKRVATVFQLLLSKGCGKILEDYLLVIQCFDSDEMLEYIDNCFEEKL